MKTFKLFAIAAMFCAISTSAWAAKSHDPLLIKTTSVHVTLLLPPPPGPGTEEAKAELDAMVAIQNTRSKEDIERAKSEEIVSLETFQPIFGDWFTAANLPKTAKLLKQVESDSKYFSSAAKEHFKRERPYNEDDRIQPAVSKEDSLAYPSGHAIRGMLYAKVLSSLSPAQKKSLTTRGMTIGWDRVVGGVHHPSDIYAGRILGLALARAFAHSPEYKAQLAEAKAEFEAVAQQHLHPAAATAK